LLPTWTNMLTKKILEDPLTTTSRKSVDGS
jgi:hypothetical protein